MNACTYVCAHTCTYVCMYVCMHACMHACVCVCVCVCVCLYIDAFLTHTQVSKERGLLAILMSTLRKRMRRGENGQPHVVNICECMFTAVSARARAHTHTHTHTHVRTVHEAHHAMRTLGTDECPFNPRRRHTGMHARPRGRAYAHERGVQMCTRMVHAHKRSNMALITDEGASRLTGRQEDSQDTQTHTHKCTHAHTFIT